MQPQWQDLAVGFLASISLFQSDLQLHGTGSTLACPSPSAPSTTNTAPTVFTAGTLFTIQNAQDHTEWSTLLQILCWEVQYCLTLHLAFPCSIRVLRILQNQIVLNLDFLPTGRFCLRHDLLHLPSSLSWFYLLLWRHNCYSTWW